MKTPTPEEIINAKQAIIQAQTQDRPRGMPPESGLLYQPIPFAEFDGVPAERDSSLQRLALLESQINFREKRVLDLGCANGFFLLSLHETIANGVGVDYFPGNVTTASIVRDLYGLDNLRFREGAISESLLDQILAERFDVCLLMSVHHHLIIHLGLETTKNIISRLCESCDVVVIEQGSLTQEEYEAWTSRDEIFTTRAFSRLISMLESCGVSASRCSPLGLGMYRSGRRLDEDGAGRSIVAVGANVGNVVSIQRKAHKNGVVMELIETDNSTLIKNVVAGPSLAKREAYFLDLVQDLPFSPKLIQARGDLIRMKTHDVTPVAECLEEVDQNKLRFQCLDMLRDLAALGIVHHEIHNEHLVWDSESKHILLLDFETCWQVREAHDHWVETVAAPNPALGLGMYDRRVLTEDHLLADVLAMQRLFAEWGLPELSSNETEAYVKRLREAM
jgi:hypothetical protein